MRNPPKAAWLAWYARIIVAVWTFAVCASLAWNIYQIEFQMGETAQVQARVAYQKDVIYRRWASQHGGVFVPVTADTQPNPYLNVPERDIITPSGKQLTLMNPAYMTRQVHEIQNQELGIRGHITSLRPIRPQNAPDAWEAEALRAFERGATEMSTFAEIEGKPYVRLMRPLVTESSCLTCHAAQGYRVGDVRGGISVAVPLEPLLEIKQSNSQSLVFAHFVLWAIALAGIVWGSTRINQSESERARAEEKLRFISSHDALTGLYNRAHYEEEVGRLDQESKFPVSFLMVDVDHLKEVNDTLGHVAGDELLKRAASVLKASMRLEDIAARIGGDEFIMLFPRTDSLTTRQILERIQVHLKEDNFAHSEPALSFSVGMATAENHRAIHDAIKDSDARMYADKRSRMKNSEKET